MNTSLKKFIKQNYVKPKKQKSASTSFFCFWKRKNKKRCETYSNECAVFDKMCSRTVDFKENLQETFAQFLFKTIDEKGLKDSEVYRKANLDRKLFSKIRCCVDYLPSKNTVLALAVGLELDLEEAKTFLEKAGFALTKSILTDVIVEYFITNKEYNIIKINQTLDDYKLKPLGNNC